MISRVYRVVGCDQEERFYKGFDTRLYSSPKPRKIALVFNQGTVDLYALDEGKEAENEFVRYLKDEELYVNAVYQIYLAFN